MATPETGQQLNLEAVYGPLNPVITIIDLQEGAFQYGRPAELRSTLTRNVNELIDIARSNGVPVIWTRQAFKDLSDMDPVNRARGTAFFLENSPDSQWLAELDRDPNELEIIKKRYSAFHGTDYEEILRRSGINTIVLAGVNTQACINVTAMDAYDRDFRVVLATGCVNSYDEEFHRVYLKFLTRKLTEPMTNGEIAQMLQKVQRPASLNHDLPLTRRDVRFPNL